MRFTNTPSPFHAIAACALLAACGTPSTKPDTGGGPLDSDGDGVDDASDCAPDASSVYPGAPEVCNGIDDDCDALVDDADDTVTGAAPLYPDTDGDGYGAEVAARAMCPGVDGWTDVSGDCDDADAARHPGAAEDPARPLADAACDGADASLGDVHATITGIRAEEIVGWDVSGGADLDGDGVPEVLVSAYGDHVGVYRASTIIAEGGRALRTDEATFRIFGETPGDAVGYALADGCDVDGDGRDDVIISGDPIEPEDTERGVVYVLLGATLAARGWVDTTLAEADFRLVGEAPSDLAGKALACGGDLDGDGRDDVLIGAPNNAAAGRDAGALYVVLGSSLRAEGPHEISLTDADHIVRGTSGDLLGSSVARAGDVDGDGLDDLIVGAPYADASEEVSNTGAALIVFGSTLQATSGTWSSTDSDVRLTGASEGDHVGDPVAGGGDVDGDGLADVLVGADDVKWESEDRPRGSVYVIHGATMMASADAAFSLANADYRIVGGDSGESLGLSESCFADVDADGRSDVIIGSRNRQSSAGTVGGLYIVPGSTLEGAPSDRLVTDAATISLVGERTRATSGDTVANAGDLDGDGRDDLLVGAWTYTGEDTPLHAGRVYVLLTGP